MDVKPQAYLKKESLDGVLIITFYHPQSNSLPRDILSELADSIKGASHNPEHRAILIRSSGDTAFCAGASFNELLTIRTEEEGRNFFTGFGEVILAIRNCPLFVFCRVHGRVVGGGVGIAGACDYVLATTNAAVKLSELAVGLGPFVVGPVIERKIGPAAFQALAIDAHSWRTAEWAEHHGLYSQTFDTVESMDESLNALIKRITSSSPNAMALMKRSFWEGTDHWPELLLSRAAISGKLVISPFAQSAIQSFKKVRK
jgi:methylglutaconyl-CoA hydratase